MSKKSLRILGFRAENIKRIQIVEITPEGDVVEITGENENGKTSVLDSIWWALGGEKNVQDEPIRLGQQSAMVRLKLGGEDVKYIVTRKFKRIENPRPDQAPYTSSLTVTTPEGARFGNPQEILTKLLGALTFDPLTFIRQKPEAQFEALKVFVPSFDFAANTKARKAAFDERTDVNRDAKNLWARVGAITLPSDAPNEAVDEEGLIQQLESASETNRNIDRAKQAREDTANGIELAKQNAENLDAEAADLEEKAKRLRTSAEEARAYAAEQQKRLDKANADEPIPDYTDAAAVRAELDDARRVNAVYARVQEKERLQTEANDTEAKAKSLTAKIDELDSARVKAVAEAEMPVPGLSFGDNIVLFNGVPLDQASGAQQLRVSVAIAAAMNPELRVIRIRDGADLDRKSFAKLSEFAAEHDLQLWVETVDSGRAGAVVITDGHVEGVDPATLVEAEPEEKPKRQPRKPRASTTETDAEGGQDEIAEDTDDMFRTQHDPSDD